MDQPSVTILEREEIFRRAFFRWMRVVYEATRFDGSTTGRVERLVLDRGDSVGMLLHDLITDEILLVEQFRVATIDVNGGWLLEIPAGKVESEGPESAARREAEEETGAIPSEVRPIASFYLSPGGCSERLFLYYCPFPQGIPPVALGGLEGEQEDIRIHRCPRKEAHQMIASGQLFDAKSIIALQWLEASV